MKKELSYIDSVHRDGRIWNLSMVGILLPCTGQSA